VKLVRSLAGGLGFLTIWPFAAPVSAESVLGFPLAGVLVGLCLVVVRVGAQRAGALVVGALALAADALVTRGLHYDALADTADGLGGFMEPAERLAAMDDPRLGGLGALALAVTVVVRAAVLGAAGISALGLVLALAWSRSVMGVVVLESPSAKPGGMTRWFRDASLGVRVASVSALVVFSAAIVVVEGAPGLFGVCVGTIAGGLLWLRATRALGGVTGDVVGAVGIVAETALIVGVVLGATH